MGGEATGITDEHLAGGHQAMRFCFLLGGGCYLINSLQQSTPWKTNMEPENPWLVEENHLPWDQDVRVYVSGLGRARMLFWCPAR